MKKLIPFLILLSTPLIGQTLDTIDGIATSSLSKIDGQTIAGGGSGAPAWGTYGTGTGEILFAWDGSSSSGNTVGYDDTESEVSGTLTGATISGTGADSYLVLDADEDRLTFTHAIDTDNPITVCVEFQIESNSANQGLYEISAATSSNYTTGQVRGNETLRVGWRDGGAAIVYSAITSGTITDDGSTWNDVMFSTRIDAGNDMAASSNGSTYDDEADRDITALDAAPVKIEIGNNYVINNTVVKNIRRFAIISGWQQTVPW